MFDRLNSYRDQKLVQKLLTDFLLLNIMVFINKIFITLRKSLVIAVIISAFIVTSCSNTQAVVPETSGADTFQDSGVSRDTVSESANITDATLSEADQEKIKKDQELKEASIDPGESNSLQTSDASINMDASPDGVKYSLLVICP